MTIPVGAWVRIELDGPYLAYTYRDPTHGLSAKGCKIEGEPDAALVRAVMQSPRATVRLEHGGFAVTPLRPDEREALVDEAVALGQGYLRQASG